MTDEKTNDLVTLTQISDLVSEATRMRALGAEVDRISQPLYAAQVLIAELRSHISANGDTRDGQSDGRIVNIQDS